MFIYGATKKYNRLCEVKPKPSRCEALQSRLSKNLITYFHSFLVVTDLTIKRFFLTVLTKIEGRKLQ